MANRNVVSGGYQVPPTTDWTRAASRLAKLANTNGLILRDGSRGGGNFSLIPYQPVSRARTSIKPPRSAANRLWLLAKAAKPRWLTPGTALTGVAGGYLTNRWYNNNVKSPPAYSDGYPKQPHRYVSPSIGLGEDVVRRYIGDSYTPFGYNSPLDRGTLYRTSDRLWYSLFGGKQTPAYNDYVQLYNYASDPSPLNARGKLLADKIRNTQ